MFIDNPNAVYRRLIVNNSKRHIPGLNRKGKADYNGLKGRVEEFLSSRTAKQQFEMDVALWYGYLRKTGGENWKKYVVLRLFSLLYYGGLMVHRTNRWKPWPLVGGPGQDAKGAPICSAISHTARIVIYLPVNMEGNFWHWFWGGETTIASQKLMRSQSRGAATHGLAACGARNIGLNVMKGARETKVKPVIGKQTANHYGINIALGGNGNIHPISGKGIRENGKHGHLYIAVSKNRFNGRRAILVGTEQSAPFDRQEAKKGVFGSTKSIVTSRGILNVPDQYGGGHGLGGHSRFSATGGDDFSYSDKPTQLGKYGPSRGHYIDGMYVDLTADRFENVCRMATQFTWEMIGLQGVPP